jgi:uncharacterized membrane-anchored protein YitT (DUF2179 family)
MSIISVRTKAKKRYEESHPLLREAFRMFMIVLGAGLVAVGLEFFLVPNGFLDGGVTGISIMVANLTGLPLGVFIAVLNIPFLILAWKFEDFKVAIRTAVGIAALSGFTLLLHHRDPLTEEYILALGYGGVLLGLGVGLALRYGGALDGIESLAHILSKRTFLDVDKLLLTANFFIFVVAAFVNSPEQAMGSFLLFYLVVAPLVKKVTDDGSEQEEVKIISTKHTEIADMIHGTLNHKVIFTDAHRDNLEDNLKIVTVFIDKSEKNALTTLVEEIDAKATVIFNEASVVRLSLMTNKGH